MEWVKGKQIGHGSFAKVCLAKPINQNSQFPRLIAVKSCGEAHSDTLVKERMILDQLKECPEIIKCYGESFSVEKGEKLYNVALEYASGGSLADRVQNSVNLKLSESDVRKYTKCILKGLLFIHGNGFVHCDIKLANILLFASGDVKIADFGLAKEADELNMNLKYEIRGSPLYMAPEAVSNGEQGPASDIWAFGCLVSEMFTGKPAWKYSDVRALFMKIGIGAEIPEIPEKLSDAGKDFLGKCFVKDPSKRWTAEMLLNHPFIIDGEDRATSSNSPRNPFEFLEWELERSVSVTPTESESESWTERGLGLSMGSRLRQLVMDERPDWSGSSGWITVR